MRDRGLLESACAVPASSFRGQLLHPDLAAMAAAYLFHLNKNHPFTDGNKRVSLAAAETFLAMNGWDLKVTNEEAVEMTLQVADGRLDKELLSAFMRLRLVRRS